MLKTLLPLITINILITLNADAATGYSKGKIKNFRVHDGKEYPGNWAPPVFWFTLEGVTAAGTCRTWNGNPLFVMDSQMAFSMVLAYQLAGKEIAIYYDDTKLNSENAWCRALYITGGDQIPLS